MWRTWLFIAYSDERWLYHQFSLPHMYFLNLGVKGLRATVRQYSLSRRGCFIFLLLFFCSLVEWIMNSRLMWQKKSLTNHTKGKRCRSCENHLHINQWGLDTFESWSLSDWIWNKFACITKGRFLAKTLQREGFLPRLYCFAIVAQQIWAWFLKAQLA